MLVGERPVVLGPAKLRATLAVVLVNADQFTSLDLAGLRHHAHHRHLIARHLDLAESRLMNPVRRGRQVERPTA